MSEIKYGAIRAALELLSLSRLPALVRARSRCRGVIFTLHRVLPSAPVDFSPNSILQVTPAFLEAAIERTRQSGFDILSLDDALERMRAKRTRRPFAVFTFDDAYRDNLQYALPILQRLQCPFTLYVPTALVDGVGEVWWQALEDVVATSKALVVPREGEHTYVPTGSLAQKNRVYARLYWEMRSMPEPERAAFMRDLAVRAGIDMERHCRSLIMAWSELQAFADEPLCTIGAHTVHHYELSKLTEAQARAEMLESVTVLEAQLGRRPQHLSYPIGSLRAAGAREYAIAESLGFRSAVTTVPGGLFEAQAHDLMALPRISLNGHFQSRRYLDVFLAAGLFGRPRRLPRPRLERQAGQGAPAGVTAGPDQDRVATSM